MIGKGDAASLLHLDGVPVGGLENWRDGKGCEFCRFDLGRALTPIYSLTSDSSHPTARRPRGAAPGVGSAR